MTAPKAPQMGHLVLLANAPWTDTKQLCIFATRVVKLAHRPVTVTLFTNEAFLDRARREVSSELAQDASRASNVRIIVLPADRHQHFVDPTFEAALEKVYRQLVAGEIIRCAATGDEHGPLPVPHAIITPKNSTLEALVRLRAASSAHPNANAKNVKLFAWCSRVPATLFFFHSPAERGGIGDIRKRVKEEAARRRAPEEEVCEETIAFLDSTLIRVPGYEPIYNHEIQPQELNHHGNLGLEWLTINDMFTTCDGVLLSTPECYDALSIIGARAWMAETARGLYAVGPTLSAGAYAVENELMQADRGTEVRDFVSRVLKSHGPRSLLYISLGQWMWPKDPEKMWTLLDVVMELRIPFILSHASGFARIPDEVQEKVDRYQLGLLSSWCPQQMILNHPVTAWFLTHCGQCSVMEAISAGVPMICWPFAGDGALNAIHLTDTLKCAYELLEVRSGHGLGRIYRTGARASGSPAALRAEARDVLAKAFGEDGARKRENVAKVQARFAMVWREVPGGKGKGIKGKGKGREGEGEGERRWEGPLSGLEPGAEEGQSVREMERFLAEVGLQ
ncbi:UDP-Glycosyltransferase/glycogen phosphorylase [Cubamyces lactineus]|nr:UDP-Glycosyltransferase/glycogen phosphorylase [Cubamyces lactineus]